MLDFTLLEEDQIFSEYNLEIFDKYGTRAAITDFSILLGGGVSSSCYTCEGRDLKNRTGDWWTKTKDFDLAVVYVDAFGDNEIEGVTRRVIGIRPSISYYSISSDHTYSQRINGVAEVLFGEYPQMIVDIRLSNELECLYNEGQLKTTGKIYTTDSVHFSKNEIPFKSKKFQEYEYKGNKYIRVIGDLNNEDEVLSNGRRVVYDLTYWVKVEPIEWLVDERTGIAISKKILFAGVQFDDKKDYDGNFESTNIKHFLDDYFSKEIVQGYTYTERKVNNNTKTNPYNFTLDNVSEEEIISGSIESDIPVFLHGPSSEGKSARVLEIDKDTTIIYLANESPDTINGKSVYNEKNNEMIDIKPSWLVKLEEKCKDEKVHILFFDEITNAFPRVQGIVFNIILNKEVNGKWKLPENARIVAAGNEMEDSLSANELSEPLFNRFAHVYIKTTTESWLKWASTHNIHPAIYSFITYKNGSVLRSKYDGKKVNADPRKWEMASKMLYRANNPTMLRSLVGEDITKEFLAFCSSRVITLEDVLTDNYSNEDIEGLNTAERYATVMGLVMVDENNIRKVREFIKSMNSELLKVFDNLWANNENRLEILSEIELEKDVIKLKS